jgi:hypothetical protein
MFELMRKDGRSTKLGATVCEALVAMSLFYVVFGLYVQCFTTGKNNRRVESKVQRCHDVRTAFFSLTDELERAKSVSEPAIFACDSKLTFANENHEKVTYFVREEAKGKELVRKVELTGEETVLAKNVAKASFYRSGKSAVSLAMRFTKPGSEETVAGDFRTLVTLRNGIY